MQILLIPISVNWILGAVGFGITELIGLLIACGVIVLIWRSKFEVVEASCGACDYPVRGLTTDRCPECGGLFSDVGIIPAGTKRGMNTLGRCVLWSIAFAFVGTMITDVVEKYAPATYTRDSDLQLVSPNSKAYDSVRIKFHEYIDLNGNVEQGFTIRLFVISESASSIAFVDLTEASIRFEESVKSSTQIELIIESLLDWMQTSLPNTSREALRNEAAEILSAFSSLTSNGSLDIGKGFSGAGSSQSSNTGSPYIDLTKVILALLWLVGIIILIKQKPTNLSQFDNSSGVKTLY